MRMLIVDDTQTIRDVVGDILEKQGGEVDRAENCQQARSLLEENAYEWVILDLILPDGSGIDILKEIQTQCPSTRVVIISFDAHDPLLCKELLSIGAEAVFPKPFELQELIECIYGPGSVSK